MHVLARMSVIHERVTLCLACPYVGCVVACVCVQAPVHPIRMPQNEHVEWMNVKLLWKRKDEWWFGAAMVWRDDITLPPARQRKIIKKTFSIIKRFINYCRGFSVDTTHARHHFHFFLFFLVHMKRNFAPFSPNATKSFRFTSSFFLAYFSKN